MKCGSSECYHFSNSPSLRSCAHSVHPQGVSVTADSEITSQTPALGQKSQKSLVLPNMVSLQLILKMPFLNQILMFLNAKQKWGIFSFSVAVSL